MRSINIPALVVLSAFALSSIPACTIGLGVAGAGAGALTTEETHGNGVPGAALGAVVGAGIGYLIDRHVIKIFNFGYVGSGRK